MELLLFSMNELIYSTQPTTQTPGWAGGVCDGGGGVESGGGPMWYFAVNLDMAKTLRV